MNSRNGIKLNKKLWNGITDPAARRLMRLLVRHADPKTGVVSPEDMKLVEAEFRSGEEVTDERNPALR
jgi:hypothetical protein